jgi:iron complex outermembrane recepter protein
MYGTRSLIGGLICLACTSTAWAQATSNATLEADDAFGYTVGDDTVGIYDQSSVRGFDLESAGNYRINGTYFVKSSGVSNFFVESTAIRIGYNTIQLNLPGPSGVVDYRLRDPKRDEPSLLTIGLDEFAQPFADLNFKHRSQDERFSTSLGLGLVFKSRNEQGGEGSSWLVAGTARADIGSSGKARLFFGEYDYGRQGKFRVALDGDALPSRIERGQYLGQQWARSKGQRRIAGLLIDGDLGDGWSAGATGVFSQEDPSRRFSQFFTAHRADGTVQSTLIASPQQRATAWSGELRVGWQGRTGELSHKLSALGRLRLSRSRFGGDAVIDLGRVEYGVKPAAQIAPNLSANSADLRDNVDQFGVGLAYQGTYSDWLRINAGVLRSEYSKQFTASDGSQTSSKSTPLLFNLGLLAKVSSGIEVYGSYTKGLEESGTAPDSAANRNAVLNAIVAKQAELGLRYTIKPGLTAIIAAFETNKPYAGLDSATNLYRLIGTVKHRGVEFSLSGKLADNLSAVVGGVYLQPRLSGIDVSAGRIGKAPVGVPAWRGIGSLSYTVPTVSGLGFDLDFAYTGAVAARSRLNSPAATQVKLPSNLTLDVGARYGVNIGGRTITGRFQVLNLTNSYGWEVNGSETLTYTSPRRFRLVLTTEL